MKRIVIKKATQKDIYQFISVIILIALIVLGSALLGPIIVKTANNPENFRNFIKSKGIAGPLIFIGIQMLQVIFAFIPGEIVEVGAGYAFGAWYGLALCLIGVFISTVIIYYSTNTFAKKLTQSILKSEKISKLKFLDNPRKLETILFLLFFVPGTPKDIITYFASLTKINKKIFFLIAVFARIPSIITSTYVGHNLVKKDYISAAIIFITTGAIGILGIYIYHKITDKKS